MPKPIPIHYKFPTSGLWNNIPALQHHNLLRRRATWLRKPDTQTVAYIYI